MPTTLSQLGRVAKTQAKGQSQNQQVTPFSEQQEKHDEFKLERVNKTEKSSKEQIDPDSRKEKDRRKRRRLARRRAGQRSEDNAGADEASRTEDQDEELGVTIDLLA